MRYFDTFENFGEVFPPYTSPKFINRQAPRGFQGRGGSLKLGHNFYFSNDQ